MAGETKSASLPIIVGDLRKKSVRKSLQMGVCKNLVTVYEDTGGNQVSLPVWDQNTTLNMPATAVAEASNYTDFRAYFNASWTITPGKYVFGTILTDEAELMARETVRDEHSAKHAVEQAILLEKKLVACFASFGTNRTGTTALTVARTMDAMTDLEGQVYDFDGAYALVVNAYQYNWLAKDMSQQGLSSNYGPIGPLADTVLKKYFVNSLLGNVNVFRTTAKAIASAASKGAGLFTKDAIGLFVLKYYEMETDRDASAAITELISRAYHGSRVRFATHGVRIGCKAQ